jgi:uncharacterized SAM-binding protein YcdF (DUF218 family)
MFIVASKLLEFLLMPTVWVAVLLLVALVRRNWRVLGWALGLFLFFSNGFIANWVMRKWEVPATPLAALHRTYPVAVVLGGFTHLGRKPADRIYLNTAADRIVHSVWLYKEGKVRQLLISGGSGALVKYPDTEGANAVRLAALCGVPRAALIAETHARTTRENAVFCKQILDSLQIRDTVILVTSAFHARRAQGCFAKVGVPCRVFTTDFRSGPSLLLPDQLLVPTSDALSKWDVLLHEWAGCAMYALAGYL